MTKKCICGQIAEFSVEDYTKTVRKNMATVKNNKENLTKEMTITIKNVPRHTCSLCSSVWFNLEDKIASCITYAFRNDFEVIDLNEFKKIVEEK